MRVHGVHATVAQQTHQVKPAAARVVHGSEQRRILKKSPEEIIRSMRVTSIWITRPAPMFRCPTSLLPICPSGSPTNGPEVWTRVFGISRAAVHRRWACAPPRSRCLRSPASSPSHPEWSGPAASISPCAYCRNALRAGVACGRPEILFDAQQLIVLGDAIGAAGRSGLDLAGVGGHGQIGDECVFGFAGPVRNHRRVARARPPSSSLPASRSACRSDSP